MGNGGYWSDAGEGCLADSARSSNRPAYGVQLRVESGGISQFLEVRANDGYVGSNDTRQLVYLPGGNADVVEVHWPRGAVTRLEGEAPGWLVVDEERGVIARRRP